VIALAVSGSDLYAGGVFTTAGGVNANYIAKWDGSAWSALGSGIAGSAYALAVSGTDLYAGGNFLMAGSVLANCTAKWDGSDWTALGSGIKNVYLIGSYTVNAMAMSGTDLYVGGWFDSVGWKVSPYLAKANLVENISVIGGRIGNLVYSPAAGFSFTLSEATTGKLYRIQSSPSLAAGSWTDFTNFTYSGSTVINDSSSNASPVRFYRAISP
jgi:hypothetical protein